MSHALVIGEALVDLLEGDCAGERVYRPAVGGAPLNVAVGAARLGGAVQFVGAVGDDVLGTRIRGFLVEAGVGVRGLTRAPAPTALAVTTFDGAEPQFRFYGDPPSYGAVDPTAPDPALLRDASLVSCGSIGLLDERLLAVSRRAWRAATGLRVFDPNVRPSLGVPASRWRRLAEEFAAGADLVKLSVADAAGLYGDDDPVAAARRMVGAGARIVLVTCGPQGALLAVRGERVRLPAPPARAVDATGAGDSVLGALVYRLLTDGAGDGIQAWVARTEFALQVAALVCEAPGGATAMPTLAGWRARWAAG